MSLTLFGLGDYKEAKEGLEEVLKIRQQCYGENNFKYALTLQNLSKTQGRLQEYETAKTNYRKALQIIKEIKKNYSPDQESKLQNLDPEYAATLQNLASIFFREKKYQEAYDLYLEALEITREYKGENNPEYAIILQNLSNILDQQKDYKGAKEGFEQALEITKRHYGESHPEYATTLQNLAGTLEKLGDIQGSKKGYKKALEIRKIHFGIEHPDYSEILQNLSYLFYKKGKYDKARDGFVQALNICIKYYKKQNFIIDSIYQNLKLTLKQFENILEKIILYIKLYLLVQSNFGIEFNFQNQLLEDFKYHLDEFGGNQGLQYGYEILFDQLLIIQDQDNTQLFEFLIENQQKILDDSKYE